jgi:uncharacterized protein YdhG (YjbR/CyaY superfamily)
VQAILKKVRAAIRKAVPDAEECISYRMPAFFQGGVVVFFAAFTNHIGMYPPVRGHDELERDLAPYRGEKGNPKFPLDESIPYELIRRVVKCRLRANEVRTIRAEGEALGPRPDLGAGPDPF